MKGLFCFFINKNRMKPPLNNGMRVASNSMKIISYQNITFKKHPNILLNFIAETYGNKFILPFFYN